MDVSITLGGAVAFSGTIGDTVTSTTYTDIANNTVTITTSGRPVYVGLVPNNTSSGDSLFKSTRTGAGSAAGRAKLIRDSTDMCVVAVSVTDATLIEVPVGTVQTIDFPVAGTYTYKIQLALVVGNNVSVSNCRLVAYEL